MAMEQIMDGKGCGCERCEGEKQLKQVEESKREYAVHFRRPWSAHWLRRTCLTVLEGGSGVIRELECRGRGGGRYTVGTEDNAVSCH